MASLNQTQKRSELQEKVVEGDVSSTPSGTDGTIDQKVTKPAPGNFNPVKASY